MSGKVLTSLTAHYILNGMERTRYVMNTFVAGSPVVTVVVPKSVVEQLAGERGTTPEKFVKDFVVVPELDGGALTYTFEPK